MSLRSQSMAFLLRRVALEAQVAMAVRRANMNVGRAFRFKPLFPYERAAALSGAGMAAFAMAMALSYALTGPTDASIKPPVKLASPVVRPEPVAAPEAAPRPSAEQRAEPSSEPAVEPAVNAAAEPEQPAPAPEPEAAPAPERAPEPDSAVAVASLLGDLPPVPFALPFKPSDSYYTIAVDKSRKKVFVLEENKDNYTIVKTYDASLGAKRGDKMKRGDYKTPEGLYRIIAVKKQPGLPDRYGPMAFVLDYPNQVDASLGKTGGGIWIHGSGLGEKTKDTEGCVEVNDFNIELLAEFAEVGTPVYIFPEDFEIPLINGTIQKNIVTPNTLYSLKERMKQLAGAF